MIIIEHEHECKQNDSSYRIRTVEDTRSGDCYWALVSVTEKIWDFGIHKCPYCGVKLELPKEEEKSSLLPESCAGCEHRREVWASCTEGNRRYTEMWYTCLQDGAPDKCCKCKPPPATIEVSREVIESWALRASRMKWTQLGIDIRKVLNDE